MPSSRRRAPEAPPRGWPGCPGCPCGAPVVGPSRRDGVFRHPDAPAVALYTDAGSKPGRLPTSHDCCARKVSMALSSLQHPSVLAQTILFPPGMP
ncbi:hypothetical protein GGTG_12695 [Gaeumannomyces tritici R3-111a-1]|uniref:Uncharacterized protein n=1 Tax=Gaeumannomyces tritici (strain R3-111a-1) TaxID=644352 RepID=J3PGR6_GAET3|nr:hypothetical protein GGTG_12695 [Gaeumannomyces tritici R3-111a-1]EJT69812.1 hypothetical protein GGTG_12695 [Gaeumannomyces tritici R3-111a-1]